jgi:hypothetical protein
MMDLPIQFEHAKKLFSNTRFFKSLARKISNLSTASSLTQRAEGSMETPGI